MGGDFGLGFGGPKIVSLPYSQIFLANFPNDLLDQSVYFSPKIPDDLF